MKKYGLTLVLIVASFALSVSQKCTYYKNEVDKYTNKRHVSTKARLFGNGAVIFGDVYFVYNNDAFSIQFYYAEEFSTMRTSIESGADDELWFYLTDGSVMKLHPNQAFKGSVVFQKKCTFSPWYPITKEQVETLTKTPIRGMRLAIAGGVIEKEVSDKNQAEVRQAAVCLLDGLGETVELPKSTTSAKDSTDPKRPKDPVIGKIYDAFHKPKSDESGTKTQQATTNPPPLKTGSTADELLKLKQLLDAGLLTQEEFNTQKKKLLESQ